MSAWMELLRKVNMLKMIVTPRRHLRGTTGRVLKKWDQLSQEYSLAGVGSADVHAHAYRKGPLRVTIFPYKVQFRSIRTHLMLSQPLSNDIKIAKKQIIDAIRGCRVFVSNFRWGDARGFQFYGQSSGGAFFQGDRVKFSDNLRLKISSPQRAHMKLIRNGESIMELQGARFEVPLIESGVYRVELHRKGRGWIYSNHIAVI